MACGCVTRRRCSLVAASLLVLLGIFHIYLFARFSPVFSTIECGKTAARVEHLHFSTSSINASLRITVQCSNPNAYAIDILESRRGRVFVSNRQHPLGDLVEVGQLQVVPGSFLQEYGTGFIRIELSTVLADEVLGDFFPFILETPSYPILLQLQFRIGIAVQFGCVGTWTTEASFDKACGLNMGGVFSHSPSLLGAVVCGQAFEELQIPPLGEEVPADGNMGFTAQQVAADEVARGELAKNLSLGMTITCCFLGALLCLFLGGQKSIAPSSPKSLEDSEERSPGRRSVKRAWSLLKEREDETLLQE